MNKITTLAFVLLSASVSPVFAGRESATAGKSQAEIILELERRNEVWNDRIIAIKWFGIGALSGAAALRIYQIVRK
jgi:hypothetical protein